MLSISNFDKALLKSYFEEGTTTNSSERIENLRPKSPPAKSGGSRGKIDWDTWHNASFTWYKYLCCVACFVFYASHK